MPELEIVNIMSHKQSDMFLSNVAGANFILVMGLVTVGVMGQIIIMGFAGIPWGME